MNNDRALFLANEWIKNFPLKEDDFKALGGLNAVYKFMQAYENTFSPVFIMNISPNVLIFLSALMEKIEEDEVPAHIRRNLPVHEFAMELFMNSLTDEAAQSICTKVVLSKLLRNHPEMVLRVRDGLQEKEGVMKA